MKWNARLKEKVYESIASVVPITAIVLILSISIAPMSPGALILFLFGALMLVFGMGFFTLGVDMSMIPMGEGIGVVMSKSKKIGISLIVCFILGILITVAEPDLQVLANQVPAIPNLTLILTVAIGVGIFLVLAEIRMLFNVPLSYVLVFFYILIFILAYFTPNDFTPVSFDSGGVTTGPITVPFVMALGIGMASVRSDKNSNSDSFGLISLCSIGPVLAVLFLGIFYRPEESTYTRTPIPEILTTKDAARQFLHGFPVYAKEVFVAIIPIILLFVLFSIGIQTIPETPIDQDQFGNDLYLCWAGIVSYRRKCRIYAGGTIYRGNYCWRGKKMVFGSDWNGDWLFYCKSGACSTGSDQTGGRDLKRFDYTKIDQTGTVCRYCPVCRYCNASYFNRDFYYVVFGSRIYTFFGNDIFCPTDFYRYCF